MKNVIRKMSILAFAMFAFVAVSTAQSTAPKQKKVKCEITRGNNGFGMSAGKQTKQTTRVKAGTCNKKRIKENKLPAKSFILNARPVKPTKSAKVKQY